MPASQFRDRCDFGPRTDDLPQLMADLEKAGQFHSNREVLIACLEALVARLERDASGSGRPPLGGAADLDARKDQAAAQQSPSGRAEYWAGYCAFGRGQPLTGWSDTLFAQGWIAAATEQRRGL